MADDLEFEDRWVDPELPVEDEDELEKKKTELLKLATPIEPKIEPPQQGTPARTLEPPAPLPAPVPLPQPQTFLDKLIGLTAPKFLPGAPVASLPPAPTSPQLPPEVVEEFVDDEVLEKQGQRAMAEEKLKEGMSAPRDIGTVRMREGGLSAEDIGEVKDLKTIPRSDYLRTMRAPLRQEIESNPALKLRVAALLQLENPGAGPAVVESMLNRALYTKRSIESITSLGKGSFYGPGRIAGKVEGMMKEIANNPKLRAHLFKLIDTAYSSNIVQGHTDQGSAGDPNYEGGGTGVNINRERFNDFGGGPGGHAGARAFRANLMKMAGSGGPGPDVAAFMGNEPMAQQRPGLEGGLSDTPERAAQIAAVAGMKPLQQIKDAAERVRRAGVRTDVPAQVPSPVIPSRGETQPQAPLQQPYMPGRPTLPIPGVSHTGETFVQNQMLSPTVLSTAASHFAMQPPPPPPKGAEPSTLDKIRGAVATADKAAGADPSRSFSLADFADPEQWKGVGRFLGSLGGQARDAIAAKYDLPDVTDPANWNMDTARKLMQANSDLRGTIKDGAVNMMRGSAAGIIQKLNVPAGITVGGLALAGNLTGSETLRGATEYGVGTFMPFIENLSRTVAGIKPGDQGLATEVGEFAGRNLAFGPLMTAVNVAGEQAAPYVMEALKQAPDIPNLNPVNSAQAADLTSFQGKNIIRPTADGRHVIATTAAGPVVMDDATYKALGWTGIITLGFMAAPGAVKRIWDATGGKIDPARELASVPGSKGLVRSTVMDYWNASTLNANDALMNNYQRHYDALVRDHGRGISATVPAAVADTTHIYSRTGVRNFISSIMEKGQMRTSTMVFDSPVSMRELHDFANIKPAFKDYLRLRVQRDELAYNVQRVNAIINNPKSTARQQAEVRAKYPTQITDPTNVLTDLPMINKQLRAIETKDPTVIEGYQAYRQLMDEGRRFVQDGTYAKENHGLLTQNTGHAPNTPIFNADKKPQDLWAEIRRGQDPLHVLERELGDAVSARMHNEVLGNYIDGLPPGTHFKQVDAEFLKKHSVDPDAILKFKEDGVTHTYIADPFIVGLLTMEPTGYRGYTDSMFKLSKNAFQGATTGPLAFHFSNISAFRTWRQHFLTAPSWSSRVWGPGVVNEWMRSYKEVPRQLTPELAQAWKPAIDATSDWIKGTKLGDMVGERNVELISRILTSETYNSFRRDFEQGGGKSQSWIAQADERRAYINKARNVSSDPWFQGVLSYMERFTQPLDRMWRGDSKWAAAMKRAREVPGQGWEAWKGVFRNQADSPNMAWAFKNRNTIDPVTGQPIAMEKLVAETRRLTGDPSERGTARFAKIGTDDAGRPLPFQHAGPWGEANVRAAQTVGKYIADPYFEAVPWAGVIKNSVSATIAAMANNPGRSAAWLGATQIMPEALAYTWNTLQGPDYVNYMMEGRSENMRNNYTYIAVPGRKPWQGIELPDYQEGLPFRRSGVLILDQMMGRSPYTFAEERADWLWSSLKNVAAFPLPSPYTALAGWMGATAPEGIAGNLQVPKMRGIKDDVSRPDNAFEMALRGIVPVVVDYWTQYRRATYSSENGWFGDVITGGKAVIERSIERTPITRDILGMHAPAAASSRITEDLYKRKHAIDDLNFFYSKEFKNRGVTNTRRRSNAGGALMEKSIDPGLVMKEGRLPGMSQEMPTNPIYAGVMKEMEMLFKRDSPEKGGAGYPSLWAQYSMYTKYIDSMRNVSDERAGTWLKEHEKILNPMERQRQKEAGIDQNNYRQVKDYYTNQRNKMAKEIFYYIRAAEQRIDQMPAIRQALGPNTHFTIEMAHPYKHGLDAERVKKAMEQKKE